MRTVSDSDYQNIITFLRRGSDAIKLISKNNLKEENMARRMNLLSKKLKRNEKNHSH